MATTAESTICRLVRIDWDTWGGSSPGRWATPGPDRLEEPFEIGVNEVSWRRRHNYLTLVSDHHTNRVVWGAPGRETLNRRVRLIINRAYGFHSSQAAPL